jgi:flagellin
MSFATLKETTIAGVKDAAAFTIKAGDTIGSVAGLNSKLYDVEKFWDANGNFILENPVTIGIVQGDGKTTSVSIFGSDTIADVRDKLNDAIANGLGQKNIFDVGTADADKFVSYVTTADSTGLEAVKGTFVIRSAMTGQDGTLTFVGDDAVLNALSLTTIQATKENKFEVSVYEAHSGTAIKENYKIEGNLLVGIVHKNIDVEFASNSGLKATFNTATKTFDFSSIASGATTFVHVADRSTIFHVGANAKQDIAAGFGNMSSIAMGIDKITVTSNALANRAIKALDGAIGRVSSERAKFGALQNRLDHTINNLTVTAENLTAAESRIRDVDMAKEMMNFTRWNILAQASTAMLAQANQMPQGVLQLLR